MKLANFAINVPRGHRKTKSAPMAIEKGFNYGLAIEWLIFIFNALSYWRYFQVYKSNVRKCEKRVCNSVKSRNRQPQNLQDGRGFDKIEHGSW